MLLYVNLQNFVLNLLEYYLTQTVDLKVLKLIKNFMNHHRMLLTAYKHINVLSIWILTVSAAFNFNILFRDKSLKLT